MHSPFAPVVTANKCSNVDCPIHSSRAALSARIKTVLKGLKGLEEGGSATAATATTTATASSKDGSGGTEDGGEEGVEGGCEVGGKGSSGGSAQRGSARSTINEVKEALEDVLAAVDAMPSHNNQGERSVVWELHVVQHTYKV